MRVSTRVEYGMLALADIVLYSENGTSVSYKPVSTLSMEEKLLACYLHACVLFVQGECLTNSTLRNRFGLGESSSGMASRIIKEAVGKKYIKPFDPDTAPRYMKYIPIWA